MKKGFLKFYARKKSASHENSEICHLKNYRMKKTKFYLSRIVNDNLRWRWNNVGCLFQCNVFFIECYVFFEILNAIHLMHLALIIIQSKSNDTSLFGPMHFMLI